jgi:hypothetical protein
MSDSRATITRWTEVLDDLDAELTVLELRAAEPSLADGLELTAPWSPPTDLDPLPAEMVERATQVIRRMLTVESRLEARREQVGEELAFVARRRAHARPADGTRAGLDLVG